MNTGTLASRAKSISQAAVYVAGIAVLLSLIGDKYSFGEFETARMVSDAAASYAWQVWAAGGSVVFVIAVLVSFRTAPTFALSLATLEATLFAAVNGVLYSRDGYLRFVDWDYGHSETRLHLFYVGVVFRLLLAWQLNRLRTARSGDSQNHASQGT